MLLKAIFSLFFLQENILQKSESFTTGSSPITTESPPLIDLDLFEALPLILLVFLGLLIISYLVYLKYSACIIMGNKKKDQFSASQVIYQSNNTSIPRRMSLMDLSNQKEKNFFGKNEKRYDRSVTATPLSLLKNKAIKHPSNQALDYWTPNNLFHQGEHSPRSSGSINNRTINKTPPENENEEELYNDPIALERTLDFLNIFGMLMVNSDGSLVNSVIKPGEELSLEISDLGKSFSFNPLEYLNSGAEKVHVRMMEGFSCLYATGKYVRLVFLLKKKFFFEWLIDAMKEALQLLEQRIERRLKPEFIFPSTLKFQVQLTPEEILSVLERYLPVSFLYPLEIHEQRINSLEEKRVVSQRFIANWKNVSRYLRQGMLAQDLFLSISLEELPFDLPLVSTLDDLWDLLRVRLGREQEEAARTLIMGLLSGIITPVL